MRGTRADEPTRAGRGQALVEYTILLSACVLVVVFGLFHFVSADYHEKLFHFWAGPLGKPVELFVVGEE